MLSFGGAREHVSFFLSYFFVGEKKTVNHV